MKNIKNKIVIVVLSVICCFNVMAQDPGQTFSYQGQLMDNGVPANGSYDFSISPFVGSVGGSVFGQVSTHATIDVSNGLFNLSGVNIVDFGGIDPFDGLTIWLEVGVRPSGTGAFEPLSPRQKIHAVPYADNLTRMGASSGQVLAFDGVRWEPSTPLTIFAPWTEGGQGEITYSNGKVIVENLLQVDFDASIGTSIRTHRLTVQADTDNKALRLIGDSGSFGHGARLNFGDAERVYIDEATDDDLTIHAFDELLIESSNGAVKVTSDDSGGANLLAYVYGRATSTGLIVGNQSSGGFSITKTGTGQYRIDFTDTSINSDFMVLATANSSSPKFVTTTFGADAFNLDIWDTNGNHTDHSFQFVVYRK